MANITIGNAQNCNIASEVKTSQLTIQAAATIQGLTLEDNLSHLRSLIK